MGMRENLEDALELADIAERMIRARIRRETPTLTDAEVEQRVLAWLEERPTLPEGGPLVERAARRSR